MTRRRTAPGIGFFLLFAFAIGSSCDASYTDCSIVCAENGDCPSGLRCNNGHCSSGPVCGATDGAGGDGDANTGGDGGSEGPTRVRGTGGTTPTGGSETTGGDGGGGTTQGGASPGGAGQSGAGQNGDPPGGSGGSGGAGVMGGNGGAGLVGGSGGAGVVGGGGGSGPWTPRELPGLALWLDAGAGVEELVASDTSRVGMWRDQSGNGNHALQVEPRMQPILSRMGANGRPTLAFVGPITFMSIDDSESLHVGNRNFTLQVVTAWLNSTLVTPTSWGYALIFSKQTQSWPYTGVGLYANDAVSTESRLWAIAEGETQFSSMADNLNDNTLRLCGYRRVGTTTTDPGNLEVRINGSPSGRLPLPTQIDLSARGAVATIGGQRAETYQALSGTVAEVVYVIGDLSEQDHERLERYLNEKYRLWSP